MSLLQEIRALSETPFDGFIFSPHEKLEEHTHIETFKYKDPGTSVGGSKLGNNYEIVFLEHSEDGGMIIEDAFDAILADPVVYLEHLIKCGFYGIIGRKTTTSDLFFDSIFE
jgi:hypothetical protein